MPIAIIGLAFLFFLGHALSWFFSKTKIPDLLILVILGYLLGPVLGVLDSSDFGKVGGIISTLALIVILYEGGLNLSTRDLLTSSLPAAGLSLLGFFLTGLAGFVIVYGLALQPWPVALLIAVGIGSTSSAIVIPMVKFLSIQDKTKTILSLESAFTDVLTIVMFLVLVDGLAAGSVNIKDILVGLGPKTLLAAVVGMISALTWAFIKRKFSHMIPKAFAGEAWALLTYGVLEYSSLNGAIGVLSLGFILANLDLVPEWTKKLIHAEPISTKEMHLLKEITFLLRTFFFIYLGILIQLSNWKVIVLALVICVAIFLVRYVSVLILYKPEKYQRLDAMITTAMGPRGLACAVLATVPLQKGVEGGEWIRDTLFAVIPFSILLTALFVMLSEKEKIRMKMEKPFGKFKEDQLPTNPEPALEAHGETLPKSSDPS